MAQIILMIEARYAAPKPLSILTTAVLGEQEFNIPKSAASPPNEAPYPTDVGTQITGAATRPPTTLGSAPFIPAQTTSTRARERTSRWARCRCRPATPNITKLVD